MEIETEAGSAEEQPARDKSPGDEVIRTEPGIIVRLFYELLLNPPCL